MHQRVRQQLSQLFVAGAIIALGLVVLKFLPMKIWGDHILFDASAHIATALFCLYVAWFFVDQEPNWRMPFFVFAATIIIVISLQRLLDDAHNDIGLLLGLLLGLFAIGASRWSVIRKYLQF